MTTVAGRAPSLAEATSVARPPFGLSGRVILLTLGFMMLAEILIYVPALASFRQSWLSDRLMASQMIALALTAAPQGDLPGDLETKLLAGVKGAEAIGVRAPGARWLLVSSGRMPPGATAEADFRTRPWYGAVRGLWRTLGSGPDDTLRVISSSAPGIEGVEWVELIIREAPLKAALLEFSTFFLLVSLAILVAMSALLYLSLHVLVIAPVRRLSENISGFAANPDDTSRVIRPSGRMDEIGTAEIALARMEASLAGELRSKRRLADLGLAVSKINHELRNMLTTAQLLGDRLTQVEDPAVRRVAPRLIRTVDRAIAFCTATLVYGRVVEPAPDRRRFPLLPLVLDQLDHADGHGVTAEAPFPPDLEIDADREQLGRALLNLFRNSVHALMQAKVPDARITVTAGRTGAEVWIRVVDNGPGVPPRSRSRLFSAFQASESSGGTGLGLPVAAELIRQHGGSIDLEETAPGASFLVRIPNRPAG